MLSQFVTSLLKAISGQTVNGIHSHCSYLSNYGTLIADYQHLLSYELVDGFEVLENTTTGANAAELEQGLCELAVLDVGLLVKKALVALGVFGEDRMSL